MLIYVQKKTHHPHFASSPVLINNLHDSQVLFSLLRGRSVSGARSGVNGETR